MPLPATNLKLIKRDVKFHNLPNLLTCVVITPFVQSAYILMVLQALYMASPRAKSKEVDKYVHNCSTQIILSVARFKQWYTVSFSRAIL